jgi:hypothetical protein
MSALIGLAVIGALLRIRQWLEARSLWNDEVALAVSFARQGFPAILTEPLPHNQSAPPAYLFATQSATRVFGFDERALRLTALAAGLASLMVAVVVARRLLTHPLARISFVALIGFSPALIYYSNEVKQYSWDVLAVMAVLLLWSLRDHRHRVAIFAFGGFAIAVSSLVSIIALAALGIAWFFAATSNGSEGLSAADDEYVEGASLPRQFSIVLGAWVAGIALHGWYTLRAGTDREYMQDWWGARGAFPPESISGIAELEWYPLSVMRLSWTGIGEEARIGAQSATGSALVAIVVIALFLAMLRYRPDLRYLVVLILIFAWVLAELRIYPTSGRLSLYLVPLILLGVAVGLDSMLRTEWVPAQLLGVGAVALVMFVQTSISLPSFLNPLDDRDMKWIATELEERSNPTDAVIVSPGFSGKISDWYGIPELVPPDSYLAIDEPAGLPADITSGARDRIWILSSHSIGNARDRVAELSEIGYDAVCVEEFRHTYLALMLRADLAASADRETLCRLAKPY